MSDRMNPSDLNENIDRREFMVQSTKIGAGVLLSQIANNNQTAHTLLAAEPKNAHHDAKHEKIHHLIDENWEKQNPAYLEIAKKGMSRYYQELPDRKKAFFTKEEVKAGHGKCKCCSDEGNTEYHEEGNEHPMMQLRTPGSGVLKALSRPDKNPFASDFIEETAKESLKEEITDFTGHQGCGAFFAVMKAWLEAQGKMEEAKNLTQEESDKKCTEWTELVVQKMKKLAPNLADKIKAKFITKLNRPPEIHIARILYLTDVPEFNAAYEGLPQGFVEWTEDTEEEKQQVLDFADILRKIAFNQDHSFGNKFSSKAEEQFVICCIAATPEKLKILKSRAAKAWGSLDPETRNKLRIDGFVREASQPQQE